MRIALVQFNPVVGDLAGNARRIREWHRRAAAAGAQLAVYPELALCGYPPLDLLSRGEFIAEAERELAELAAGLGPVPAVVGTVLANPSPRGRPLFNVAALIRDGRVEATQPKTNLPTYDVFDEDRYFEPAAERRVVTLGPWRLGLLVCEDIWDGPEPGRERYPADPVADLARQGVDVLINISASPFHRGRGRERERQIAEVARQARVPVLLVNQVGGNDGLIFDGRSLACDENGSLLARAESFREDLVLLDLATRTSERRPSPVEGAAELMAALKLGLADFAAKCALERAVMGLSGGVDSAVVAVLAAEALGPDRVRALAMPSQYSSPHSQGDAERLARRLGVEFFVEPIGPALEAFRAMLLPELGDVRATLTEENLQARIRGTLVMAHANRLGALALATGNKSELATGYCTLYGDMAGGLAPIGDLWKHEVYELARHINREQEIIPQRILERPPSAELRPNQTDQDTLPPYDVLDAVLDQYLTRGLAPEEIVRRGAEPATVARLVAMLEKSEFKRRQACPVLRVSPRAFGAGRQIPIARRLPRGS
jgi:NAD+ synthetase